MIQGRHRSIVHGDWPVSVPVIPLGVHNIYSAEKLSDNERGNEMNIDESFRQSLIHQAAELKPPVAAEVIDKHVAALMEKGPNFAMNWGIHESMQQGIRDAIEATGFTPIDQQQEEGLSQFAFNHTQSYFECYVEDGEAMELCDIRPLQAYTMGVSLGSTLPEQELHEFLEEWPEFDRRMTEEIRQRQASESCEP